MADLTPKKKEENKFEWADEGVSTIVRVIILGWSAAILTLNYVTVPGIPQKKYRSNFHSQRVYWHFSYLRGCSDQKERREGSKLT